MLGGGLGASLEFSLGEGLAGSLANGLVVRLVGTLEFSLDALVYNLIVTLACT